MKKEVRGIVLRAHSEPIDEAFAAKIKPILSVSESAPAVSKEQLELWQWMSEYYMCSLGEVMAAALPVGLDKRLLEPPKRRRTAIAPYSGPIEPMHALSPAQAKSADEIGRFWSAGQEIVLLHGVTSSGKTDIYIHLIHQQLAAGKNVLYLVPEIALTTQLTSRLQCIFGDKLIVYHSRFTDAEREQQCRKGIAAVMIEMHCAAHTDQCGHAADGNVNAAGNHYKSQTAGENNQRCIRVHDVEQLLRLPESFAEEELDLPDSFAEEDDLAESFFEEEDSSASFFSGISKAICQMTGFPLSETTTT